MCGARERFRIDDRFGPGKREKKLQRRRSEVWRSILFSILYFVGGFIFYRFAQTELVGFIFDTSVDKTIDKTIVNDTKLYENSPIELLHLVSSTEFFTGYTTATLEKLRH